MNKAPSRISAARRNAETILSQSRQRQQSFKADQERERDAMMEKTTRLRELRLAKEAEEKAVADAEASAPAAPKPRKPRRSKQT
ncbi:MAG TPA: transcriptional regulator [Methyloceanibacter sp.]|nr:transcriptional regulator [Methyloceanibacter sp.]